MVIKSCCMFVKTYFQILLCLIKFWRFINCFFSHNHSSLSVLDITKVWHCNPTYISSLFHFSGSLGTIPNSSCERGSRIVCMWGQFYSIWLQSLTADMRYCSPKTDCWVAGASTVQYSDRPLATYIDHIPHSMLCSLNHIKSTCTSIISH